MIIDMPANRLLRVLTLLPAALPQLAGGCGDAGVSSAIHLGGEGDELVKSVTVAPAGDIVLGGEFSRQTTYGDVQLTSVGDADGFVVVVSREGLVRWARGFGGKWGPNPNTANGGDDFVASVAVDAAGDVLVTGYALGEVDLGAGAGPPPADPDPRVTGFTAKYAGLDGTLLWSHRFGQTVSLDDAGNAYVMLTPEFIDTPAVQIFFRMTSLDPDGNIRWEKAMATRTPDGSSMNLDRVAMTAIPGGGVVLAAVYTGSMDVGAGPVAVAPGEAGTLIAWFDADGNPVSSSSHALGGTLADIVIATSASEEIVFANGGVQSFAPDGAPRWTEPYPVDHLGGDRPFGVAILPDGDVLAGSEGQLVRLAAATGAVLWTRTYGDMGQGDDPNQSKLNAFALDPGGEVVVAGNFTGSLEIDGGTLESNGLHDLFVSRFTPPPGP